MSVAAVAGRTAATVISETRRPRGPSSRPRVRRAHGFGPAAAEGSGGLRRLLEDEAQDPPYAPIRGWFSQRLAPRPAREGHSFTLWGHRALVVIIRHI